MMTPEQLPDWFVDLIDARVTSGLDDAQQKRFDDFVQGHDDRDEVLRIVEQYELTAAALDLQFAERSALPPSGTSRLSEQMPDRLKSKLLQDAKVFFEAEASESGEAPQQSDEAATDFNEKALAPAVQEIGPGENRISSRKSPGEGITTREAIGWLVAAASVAILLTGWNPFASPPSTVSSIAKVSVEQELEGLIESPPSDLTRVAWQATDEKSKAGGEVFWSDSKQTGYMVFNNLPVNDSSQSQYQLWIFDTDVGQAHPVDGGTFDVTSLEKAVVKIDARILVDKAVMFAVTEEVPGGVVVSSRERLPLLAKVD